MIVHLSVHTPKPGKEQGLIALHAPLRRRRPWTARTRSTRRRSATGTPAASSGWHAGRTRRHGSAGVEAMRAAVADDPFDEWEAAEVQGFFLEEV